MAHITDGGPAFPAIKSQRHSTSGDMIRVYSEGGMSLRDYFAAKAMKEAIRRELVHVDDRIQPKDFDFDAVANTAYVMADAMLRARAAQSPADIQAAHVAEFGK